MKKALITGGCGFVGRHMCKRLIDDGYYVVAIDNLSSEGSLYPSEWPKHLFVHDSINFVFVYMSCEEFFKDDVEYFGQNPQWDLIIHLAAIVGGRSMIENQPLQVAKDLEIDSIFFNWATGLLNKPRLIVYFSSSAAYPIDLQKEDSHRKLKEEDLEVNEKGGLIGIPDMSYGWAKLTGEFLAQLVRNRYDLPIAIYRPFSGFGEDQSDCYPFMSILNKVLKEENVEIWSDNYRDFVYIDDVVDCVLDTMNKVAQEKTELNIASGQATSFSELATSIAEILGKSIRIKVAHDKPKGVYYRVGDISKSQGFGWIAKTSLMQAIETILSYKLQ